MRAYIYENIRRDRYFEHIRYTIQGDKVNGIIERQNDLVEFAESKWWTIHRQKNIDGNVMSRI